MNIKEVIEILQNYDNQGIEVSLAHKNVLQSALRMDKDHIHFEDEEKSVFEISIANEERGDLAYKALDNFSDSGFSDTFEAMRKKVFEMPRFKYCKVFCLSDYVNKNRNQCKNTKKKQKTL